MYFLFSRLPIAPFDINGNVFLDFMFSDNIFAGKVMCFLLFMLWGRVGGHAVVVGAMSGLSPPKEKEAR